MPGLRLFSWYIIFRKPEHNGRVVAQKHTVRSTKTGVQSHIGCKRWSAMHCENEQPRHPRSKDFINAAHKREVCVCIQVSFNLLGIWKSMGHRQQGDPRPSVNLDTVRKQKCRRTCDAMCMWLRASSALQLQDLAVSNTKQQEDRKRWQLERANAIYSNSGCDQWGWCWTTYHFFLCDWKDLPINKQKPISKNVCCTMGHAHTNYKYQLRTVLVDLCRHRERLCI